MLQQTLQAVKSVTIKAVATPRDCEVEIDADESQMQLVLRRSRRASLGLIRRGMMASTLARTLGLRDLALLAVGTVIGSGIYLVPAPVLRNVGESVPLALAVWIVGGILSVLGALTYAELGAAHPEAGGLYVYIRDAFGRLPAFLYGWALFFVIATGSLATLAVAFASYLRQLMPVGPLVAKLVAVGMIAVIAALNVRGTRQSADVQNWATAIKVAAILAMSLLLLALGSGGASTPVGSEVGPSLLSGLGIATVAVLWAYEGWQYVTFSAGEVTDPQRNFPRGIFLGTAAIMAIYFIANLGYFRALGASSASRSERIAAEATAAVLGPAAGKLIALAILVSMFSAANGLMLSASRVFFAMARDRLFFSSLARIDPRFGTPAIAVATSAFWAMLLAATGTFEQLLTYVVFAGWIFYALGAACVFVDRKRRPTAHRPFRVPGYPWTPMLFIVSAAAIVVNTLVSQPSRAAFGLLIVLSGVPAFWFWRGSGDPPVVERAR